MKDPNSNPTSQPIPGTNPETGVIDRVPSQEELQAAYGTTGSSSQTPNAEPVRFTDPKPTAGQRISMRLAGAALGLGFKASPRDTMRTLVTKVGGYQEVDDNNKPGSTRFKHKDPNPKFGQTLSDETVRSYPKRDYKHAIDFEEEGSGLELGHAVTRTARGQRTAPRKLSPREKAARRLVDRATHRNSGVYTR